MNKIHLAHPEKILFILSNCLLSWNSFRISTFSSTANLTKDKESVENAPDS